MDGQCKWSYGSKEVDSTTSNLVLVWDRNKWKHQVAASSSLKWWKRAEEEATWWVVWTSVFLCCLGRRRSRRWRQWWWRRHAEAWESAATHPRIASHHHHTSLHTVQVITAKSPSPSHSSPGTVGSMLISVCWPWAGSELQTQLN